MPFPFHSSAANGNPDFLLSDADDESDYLSVQHFRHNALNPCLSTTYDWVTQILDDVSAVHDVCAV